MSKTTMKIAIMMAFSIIPQTVLASESKFDLYCSTSDSEKDSYFAQHTKVTTFTSVVKIDLDRNMFCYYNPDTSSNCSQAYSFGWDFGSKIDDYEYIITDQSGSKFAIWKSSLSFRVVTNGRQMTGQCTRSSFTGLP